ncbi:hypothetical protein [Bacillus sp. RO1]|uniref:hypothetical protein n=1 Tax=Bacillus sp. RO1 TaxID=2722703 RepID=UPI001456A6FA|nr:hypothetical protein [Bacillus sp. RO1]NLP51276.1 hypothetical protein [Bacillus sp. RO1]
MNRKQKIKKDCANYKDGICILKGYECPLLTPFEYRGKEFPCEEMECDYFDKFVDPKPKTENKDTKYSTKKCKECYELFKPKTNATKFCSPSCRELSLRKSHRRYNAKR